MRNSSWLIEIFSWERYDYQPLYLNIFFLCNREGVLIKVCFAKLAFGCKSYFITQRYYFYWLWTVLTLTIQSTTLYMHITSNKLSALCVDCVRFLFILELLYRTIHEERIISSSIWRRFTFHLRTNYVDLFLIYLIILYLT